MVFIDPQFEQRRKALITGGASVNSVGAKATPSTGTPVQVSGFNDPQFEQRRTQLLTPTTKQLPSLAPQQLVVQPVTPPARPNILQGAKTLAGNVGSAIGGGIKTVGAKTNEVIQKSPVLKNVFDKTIEAKKSVGAGINEALQYPFGKPAGETVTTPVGHEKDGKVPEIKGAFQDPTRPYDQSMLRAQNKVFGEAGAGLLKGVTGGIIKPDVGPAEDNIDKIIRGTFETSGQIYSLSKISGLVGNIVGSAKVIGTTGEVVSEGAGLLGKSGVVTNLVSKFPSLARFIPSAITNSASFSIYNQLDPEKKDRLKSLLTDSATGIGLAALGGAKTAVAVPGSFLLGAGITKLHGGTNEDAFKNGVVFMALDLAGRLGKTKALLDKNGVDPLLKEDAIETFNKHLETPLSKDATAEEIHSAYIKLTKTLHPDIGGSESVFAEINRANDVLTGKGIMGTKTATSAEPDTKEVHTYTPQEMRMQTKETDIQGTTAGERLDTIIASAEQVGKQLQVDMTGKTGIPVVTPAGNTIGITLVDPIAKEGANASISQTGTDQNQTGIQTGSATTPDTTPTMEGKTVTEGTNTSLQGTQSNGVEQTPSKNDQSITPETQPSTVENGSKTDTLNNNSDTTISKSQEQTTSDFQKISKEDFTKTTEELAKTTQVKTEDIPHKEGYSRLQERVQEQILKENGDKYDFNPESGKYNVRSLQKDAEKAFKLLESDPEKALRIARGLEEAPDDLPANAVAVATWTKALDEGNVKLFTELVNTTSQRSTRFGQEIVSLRGNFNDNSPQNFMKRVIDARMNNLGKNVVTEASKALGNKKLSPKTKAVEKIDREVEKLSKLMKQERMKIDFAQDILDKLTCK